MRLQPRSHAVAAPITRGCSPDHTRLQARCRAPRASSRWSAPTRLTTSSSRRTGGCSSSVAERAPVPPPSPINSAYAAYATYATHSTCGHANPELTLTLALTLTTGMFLHADTLRTSSWQMQIRGRKRWHLCPGPGGVQAAILTMECMVHGAWWAARCIHCMRALHDALRDALHDTLRDALHDTLRDTLHDTLRDTLRDALHCAALHALPHVTSPPAPSRDCITYLLHCSGRLAHVLRRGEARYLRPGLP
jgi:hypothetical protein